MFGTSNDLCCARRGEHSMPPKLNMQSLALYASSGRRLFRFFSIAHFPFGGPDPVYISRVRSSDPCIRTRRERETWRGRRVKHELFMRAAQNSDETIKPEIPAVNPKGNSSQSRGRSSSIYSIPPRKASFNLDIIATKPSLAGEKSKNMCARLATFGALQP